jgi:hypothetical protein
VEHIAVGEPGVLDAFPWKDLLVGLGGVVTGGLVVLFLQSRRYSVRARKGSFAGVEYDISRFADLTQVKFFENVTRMALKPNAALAQASGDPSALIYAGWSHVAETFVRRFGTAPSDENVEKVIVKLGPQNVDFIRAYRVIQENALRDPDKVPLAFAQEYASRAPALAQRIDPQHWVFDASLAFDILAVQTSPGRRPRG